MSNEVLIPPSNESALDPIDSYTSYDKDNSKKTSFNNDKNSSSNSNMFNDDYFKSNGFKEIKKSDYDDHYDQWKKKLFEGEVSKDTEYYKIDTKGVPNNLFESRSKRINEDGFVDKSRFASISNDPNYKETMEFTGKEDEGMMSTFGSLIGDSILRTKEILTGVSEKYHENDMNNKLKTAGEMTVNVLKTTGGAIHSVVTSETTKTVINKTAENIGYLFNRLFYGGETSNSNTSNNDDFLNKEKEDDYYTKKNSYNRYSPPRNTDDDLNHNILLKKDSLKYSSKSYNG